jgi:hypothetical protein
VRDVRLLRVSLIGWIMGGVLPLVCYLGLLNNKQQQAATLKKQKDST